ncbi:MAG: TolC family protein, partial [Acidobacteriaceae bacterium]|nr:TolC family protein [Acidobacteriaceae bacterium]
MNVRSVFTVALLAALYSGCAVGPNYKRPVVTSPAMYRGVPPDQVGQTQATSFGDEKWWDAFQDDVLRDLIRTALKQNYDVQIAAARISEARAQLGITRADQLPTITAGAAGTNERSPRSVFLPAFETSATQLNASLSWELDFWGKYRRATESARASLLAQEWAQRAVISSLVSDVANAYFQLRELDLELDISRQTLGFRNDSLRLTQILADHGATSLLDVRQAEQLVFNAGAAIPD